MTDRELLQMALDALEEYCEQGVLLRPIERREALRARLAQPPKDLELPLVRPEEFVKLIQGSENYWGKPVMRTEWPTPEPYPENFIDALRFDAAQSEPTIDGWPLWSGLPPVPKGGGGVSEEMLKKVVDKLPTMPIKVAENPTKPTKVMIIPALLEQAGYVKKKEWVGLTDEDHEKIYQEFFYASKVSFRDLSIALEAKLKEKNSG